MEDTKMDMDTLTVLLDQATCVNTQILELEADFVNKMTSLRSQANRLTDQIRDLMCVETLRHNTVFELRVAELIEIEGMIPAIKYVRANGDPGRCISLRVAKEYVEELRTKMNHTPPSHVVKMSP